MRHEKWSIRGDLGLALAAVQSHEDFVLTIRETRIARKTEPYPNRLALY